MDILKVPEKPRDPKIPKVRGNPMMIPTLSWLAHCKLCADGDLRCERDRVADYLRFVETRRRRHQHVSDKVGKVQNRIKTYLLIIDIP